MRPGTPDFNCKSGMLFCAGEFQGFQGCAAGACCVAVGHDVDGDVGLFGALVAHAEADLVDEPLLEVGCSFDCAATDDECVGVEGVDHHVEEESESAGLNLEDLFAHLVAFFGETADLVSGLVRIGDGGEFMCRVLFEEVGEEVAADGSQRTERFEVAVASAVALGV